MKKNYLKKILTITVALTMCVGFVGCGNEGADNIEAGSALSTEETAGEEITADNFNIDDVGEFTIRVGVNSGDGNQYLKILDNHTGYLKDRGINLETTEFAAGINTIDAITTDQLDVGLFADYAGVNRIGNTLADTQLRAFATIRKSNAYNLYVNPDTIKEPKDLEGHTAISMAGVVFEYDYGKLFETYDIDKSKVELVNVSSTQEAIALASTNGADSFWVNDQIAPKFEEVGWKPLVNISDVDATMYTFLVANNSYLEEHEAEVAKFLKVSDEAFDYIDENLDEFAGWVQADIGLDKDLVIRGWKEATHNYTFPQDAYEDLLKVEDWCYKNRNFPTEYDFTDYINTDALALVSPDEVTWQAN